MARHAALGGVIGATALPVLANLVTSFPDIGTVNAIVLGAVVGTPLGSLIAAARDDGETADRVERETHGAEGRADVTTEGEDRKASRRREQQSSSRDKKR